MLNQDTNEKIQNEISEKVSQKLAFRVILFNDDWHSFDDVINQIIKAINCSFNKANALTYKVHLNGQAAVFEGELQECLKVSSVLEEIALHTQIES